MTPQEAQKIGRAKTLKGTIVIVAILLIILLFRETRGDFVNGILFYIDIISNSRFLIIMAILFGLTFIFGGMAGKEIILHKRNIVLTSIKYVVLIILAVIMYAAIIDIAKDDTSSTNNFQQLLVTYFLTPLAKTGSVYSIPMLIIWLWATNSMRLIKTTMSTPDKIYGNN